MPFYNWNDGSEKRIARVFLDGREVQDVCWADTENRQVCCLLRDPTGSLIMNKATGKRKRKVLRGRVLVLFVIKEETEVTDAVV